MAKMQCKCGNVLSTTKCPNEIELHVYTDEEWERLLDCEMIIPWNIQSPEHEVWRCPECQRIYVFKLGNDIPIMTYSLESNNI